MNSRSTGSSLSESIAGTKVSHSASSVARRVASKTPVTVAMRLWCRKRADHVAPPRALGVVVGEAQHAAGAVERGGAVSDAQHRAGERVATVGEHDQRPRRPVAA